MRHLFTLVFCFTIFFADAQRQLESPAKSYSSAAQNRYLQRARNQKIAAWLMLGGGTALAIFGIQKAVNAPVIIPNGTGKEGETGAVLFFAGAGTVLGSIPLFIAAGRNKRKGRLMSVNREQSFVPDPSQRNSFVALQLRIGL